MKCLNNEEMINVVGGGFTKSFIYGILGGAIVFLMGFIDGYINPNRCN